MALIFIIRDFVIKAVDEFILSPFNRSGLYAYDMDPAKGVGPSTNAWKALVLPLNYTEIK